MKVEIMTGPKAQKDKDGKYIFSQKEREFPLYKYTCSNENDRSMKMLRKQFPVRLTYCMSINKAQGQTLKRVGLYLPNPVFSHGQLYVALSRVSRPENIIIHVESESETHGKYEGCSHTYTKNHVYRQLLREEIKKFTMGEKYIGEYPNFDGDEESDDGNDIVKQFGHCRDDLDLDLPDMCMDDLPDMYDEDFPDDVMDQFDDISFPNENDIPDMNDFPDYPDDIEDYPDDYPDYTDEVENSYPDEIPDNQDMEFDVPSMDTPTEQVISINISKNICV